MKSFDPISIYDRMVEALSQNPNWKAVVNDSVVGAILKASAEQLAEAVRYSEHLFTETRWDAAQNISSITAAAGQLGYKPARKQSAFGDIIVSADPRIHLVGRSLPLSAIGSGGWQVLPEDLYLNDTITVKDSKDNNYIIASRSTLAAQESTTPVTLIEGVKKVVEIPVETIKAISTRSKLDPYIYVPVDIPSCENAETPLTRRFFKVFVKTRSIVREYRIVDTLHLSGTSDEDVEVFPDLYNPDIMYLKFNASKSRGRVLNLSSGTGITSIEVHYVESKGSEGNLLSTLETFTLSNISSHENLKLFGINLEPLSGGRDEESVYDIKTNAPQYYLNTYTVATRESYENAIKRIEFYNGAYPSRVRVYAGTTVTATGRAPVTKVSMLLPNLEDKAFTSQGDSVYENIEKTINFYMSNLKAPVDVLKFEPPKYVAFAVGVECTASKSKVDNIVNLKQGIQKVIDDNYGARSSELDFNRSIYAADIVTLVKKYDSSILSVKLEMEASQILNWNSVTRMKPVSEREFYTLRLPFSFNSVFIGKNYIKGFKDYRSGASYVMRIDLLYRKSNRSVLPLYHKSIFIEENPLRSKRGFYHVTDNASGSAVTPIWDPTKITSGYPINNASFEELETSYQLSFKKKIYSDDAFSKLIDPESLSYEDVSYSATISEGSLEAFLVWCESNEDSVGSGYFEFDIKSIYETLQTYATQDVILREALLRYPLATMQCGTLETGQLEGFIEEVLSPYVEIVVSMRPLDNDLILDDSEAHNNVVMLIDSSDADADVRSITNLSTTKLDRFVSVETSLV